jgi:hypothetical protein
MLEAELSPVFRSLVFIGHLYLAITVAQYRGQGLWVVDEIIYKFESVFHYGQILLFFNFLSTNRKPGFPKSSNMVVADVLGRISGRGFTN